ncbi:MULTISPECIES: hypothetical protein [Haloferax]|uniref:DUF8123 domain-containing protein n=2 Tax=Haloferax TaxID=2251 RepID=A0A6G1YZN1_9EURY|nr:MULTISPECIES: hypothetical protein [Haloferax]KAB1187217.1 hypothetical protein Hfx1149_03905 [Haloferax sp. CBA1149]MRW79857.1 hypothetical protein [Haloferax marinisediminis]
MMRRETAARWTSWIVVAVGVFVALYGAGTLVIMPWRYTAIGTAGAPLQILGSVLTIGIGAGVASLGVAGARKKR